MRRILVATDFSETANSAASEALVIARRLGAEVVLLHVGHLPAQGEDVPLHMRGAILEFDQLLREQFERSRADLQALRERLSGQGATVSQSLIHGYPSEAIPKAAEELDADLVVVGTHGHNWFEQLLMGSVAERVVRMTPRNVMVYRPGADASGGYRRVLVPVDFSVHTRPAIELAMTLAAPDAAIELFHAWQVPVLATAAGDGAELRAGVPDALLEQARPLVRDYGARGGQAVTFEHVEASPVAGIRKRVVDGAFDLVVMGSHGRRGIKRLALGSIAEATVRHLTCSVVIVHS